MFVPGDVGGLLLRSPDENAPVFNGGIKSPRSLAKAIQSDEDRLEFCKVIRKKTAVTMEENPIRSGKRTISGLSKMGWK